MKEIKQSFDFKFNGALITITGSNISKPFFSASTYGSITTKELKEFGAELIKIATAIENDKDFRNK